MGFIEIKQSGPDVPDGVYPFILSDIEGDPADPNQPRHVVPDQGPNAGKDLYFFDWIFAIDSPGHPLDGTTFKYGTSTKTGPRSKMYPLLTALLNGAKPSVGTVFTREQLIGRRLLGTVQRNDAGYCEIVGFSAMPAQMQQQAFASATGAPVAAPAVPTAPQAVSQPVAGAPAFVPQQIIPPQPQPAPSTVPVGAAPATDDLPF